MQKGVAKRQSSSLSSSGELWRGQFGSLACISLYRGPCHHGAHAGHLVVNLLHLMRLLHLLGMSHLRVQ